ncbi:hypothetical protein A6769_34700 [Nostoc punctiforme NIES-2108]|uniref:DUF4384 domain-containing protein n=1 Tax=Nostoc punctiforme NIES-2108 TaxID=1356359 RepID=A0A367R0U0_NOSPU|nr:hypothetical protein A6769_34700 [Nostoc punctiforme NIES-2108]
MVNINDTCNDKNLLQEAFLKEVLQHLDFTLDISKYLFKIRYNPKNQTKKLISIAKMVKNKYDTFEESCINTYAKRVNDRIVEVFKQEMLLDKLNISLISNNSIGHPQHSVSPYQITYKWLWEKKFPRMGWELAKEIATYAFDELNMIDIEAAKRGLKLDVITTDDGCCIKLNTRYYLQVDLSSQGQYLLLINKSIEGNFYLLSPSKAFADVPYTVLSENLYLPLNDGKKGRAPFFQYDAEGDEYFLAIVTEQPIELSWVHWELDSRDIILNPKRFEEIFVKLGQQSDSEVFYKRFRVLET